ncbi:MAG: pantetheine-phosphate adenylyltransferase, partial [Candidatus Gallimonas sp.]
MKKCVFAGTFDPFTVGHSDMVEKTLRLFDETVVAVAENRSKTCMFTAEERAEMIRAVYRNEPRVRVVVWKGAIVDLLREENTEIYVRGIRNTVDFEYENADFYASR